MEDMATLIHSALVRDYLAAMYRRYVNEYLTLAVFGEHHGLTPEEAGALVTLGKSCHENPHPDA